MSNVHAHPVFVPILEAIKGLPLQARRERYLSDLRRMDWQFEHGPHRQWQEGKAELLRLRAERAVVDPDCNLWRQIAPAIYRD